MPARYTHCQYDPANGFVPTGQGYLNASDQQNSATVNLSNTSVEFGFGSGNIDTADFTTTTLTIQDVSSYGASSEQQSFVSSGFIGATLTKLSDSFPSGDSISIQSMTNLKLVCRRTLEYSSILL